LTLGGRGLRDRVRRCERPAHRDRRRRSRRGRRRGNIAWARRCIGDLGPISSGGSYLNFPGFLEDRDRLVRAAYDANYDRLVAVKTAYDPENVFRTNQNIPPAVA
jgi:hypothetical protein